MGLNKKNLHCRRPLGDPNPAVANLALAVVLLIVIGIQAFFNAWQDYSTGRVMASIFGMLPTDILVTREGNTFKSVPDAPPQLRHR